MKHNGDFKYDLKIGLEAEKTVLSLFAGAKIEVKSDFWISKTGNIAIEYESRGKKSGISTTEADWWIICSGEHDNEIMFVVKTCRLKAIAREWYKKGRIKEMGDGNSSRAVLIPLNELLNEKETV